jgi:hypothetical protein
VLATRAFAILGHPQNPRFVALFVALCGGRVL